jgi:hypothetical protein
MYSLFAVVASVLLALLTTAGGTVPATEPGPAPRHATFTPPARPLPFLYDLYTFRGSRGTLLVAAYAVEAGELQREQVPSGVRYRFDVSLVLTDTASRSVISRHDSVYVDMPRPLGNAHLLFTTVEVEIAPTTSTLQRLYMYNATSPGIGQFYTTHQPVPDYSGTHLMLSDVVLAQADATGGWQRGDVSLAVLPGRQFPASAFEVYYEIYNLPDGHEYTTDIAVTTIPEQDDVAAKELARLRFDGKAAADPTGMVAELRRVETTLRRGGYVITVTVTDRETGRSASSSRAFEVHSGRGGATMVPALPVTAPPANRSEFAAAATS